MVGITRVLSRVPVIKFRKGGFGASQGAGPSAAGSAPTAGAPATQAPNARAATTSAISDLELPARYRRAPLSQEEIDHINGGGIV